MKARPILFSGPMVRALLAGSKTQTRRIVKIDLAPCDDHDSRFRGHEPDGWWCTTCGNGVWFRDFRGFPCPYGAPGDLLWVRESIHQPNAGGFIYRANWREQAEADGYDNIPDHESATRWTPSIHMPRVASRLTLEITDVRVERLQDISAEDADAECFGGDYPDRVLPEVFPHREDGWGHLSIPECYGRLWEHINGPGSWTANPWVWAVSFKVHKANVDAFAQAGVQQ